MSSARADRSSRSTGLANRAYRLRRRPVGPPSEHDLELVSEPVPDLVDGEILVRTLYLSVDPTNRLWMSDMRQYSSPVELGDVMRGIGIGEVIESRNNAIPTGTFVSGYTQWQEYCLAGPEAGFFPLPEPLQAPLTAYLGVLGHTGLTAYVGIDLAKVTQGDTVVVSAAGGAVGSIAGQIAKERGAHVVGIAGGAEKCNHVMEDLGFDACIDYTSSEWRNRFDTATPNGVDVDFENVGGEIMDHVLMRLNLNARIILCGMISQYDAAGSESGWYGQRNIGQILMQRATLRGFIVSDHAEQFPAAMSYVSELYAKGRLRHDETIVEGFDHALTAMRRLFTGEKTGKLLVHVADPG
jgi:NADPH-dependent curcumin reductase CurA